MWYKTSSNLLKRKPLPSQTKRFHPIHCRTHQTLMPDTAVISDKAIKYRLSKVIQQVTRARFIYLLMFLLNLQISTIQMPHIPALENLQQQDMVPEELLANSLYGRESNCEQGRNKYDVEVIAPAMPGNRKKMHLAEFSVDDRGWIVSCPRGITPNRVKENKGPYSAAFVVDACRDCPMLKKCPVSKGKKAYYYRYKEKDLNLASRVQYEKTEAFKEKYRFRAGVETTMSELDRRTGVKHLRVVA